MKRIADTERVYRYRLEEKQNPYIGFMSFQHFRGEKLYSDIVVTPEAKLTETERVECYPVSADAEENGRDEGYYPDTSVVYIRILWKEWEPEKGRFNYEFADQILADAKAHGQTLIFRLMAHSTRACDDVPEWLKSEMECPQRPPMMRVKDSPTDPKFVDYFLNAVKKFGERYDSDPTLDAVDISLPGAWGEGHHLELYGDGVLQRITDTYLEAFPTTQLIAQIARPNLILAVHPHTVGVRGDGFGHPRLMNEIYPPRFAQISDLWKQSPVSFEAYWWLGEWQRQGWDLDKIIEQSLAWHISSFNAKSIAIPWEWKEKIDGWVAKMGYHFVIDRVAYPAKAEQGDLLEILLHIDNVGVAPIYKKLPFVIRLTDGKTVVDTETDADIRAWLPGKHTVKADIGADVPSGTYDLEIGILCPHTDVFCFATDAERDGQFYKVGSVTVL